MSANAERKIRPSGRDAIDAVSLLSAFVVVLFAIPAALGVGALGSAGAPATLAGLAAFGWWCWHHVNKRASDVTEVQPVRWAVVAFLFAVLLSYLAAMYRPMPGNELLPADSAVLRLVAMSGVALVAHDGIRSTERMRTLVRVLLACLTAVALLSIIQFVTGRIWVDRISIPGLTRNSAGVLFEREGLTRPSGTSTHPIEFATVITMGLPLSIMYLLSGGRLRFLRLGMVLVIFLAGLLALSRTAILCMAVGAVVIVPSLPRSWRITGAVALTALIGLLGLTVPGLIGTLRGLFLFAGQDPSVASRTGAYPLALEIFHNSPLLGKGLGTFLPEYWILDNMYLQLLLETGVVGLATLLGVVATSSFAALRARRRLEQQTDRYLATGLLAGILAGATSFAFFDAFAFPQSATMFYLLVGMCGAYRRLAEAPANS